MINSKRCATWHLWQWTLLLISVSAFFVFLWSPYQGDDLAYRSAFQGANPAYDSWLYYPIWAARHWLHSNGRLANLMTPALFALPRPIVVILCTTALWLMYRLSIKIAGEDNSPMILIAGIFFLLPWWDSIFIFDCQTNYVWSSVAILAIYIILYEKDYPLWLGIPVCFLGAMMHESATVSLIAGIIGYVVINKWRPDKNHSILICFLCAGAIFTIFAPGIILRASSEKVPNDPWLWLLLKSDFIALFLWIIIIYFSFSPKNRKKLSFIFKTPLCVLAIGAFVEMIISVQSGIVGRSGWFAELFAIIVLVRWLGFRDNPIISSGILTLILQVAISCPIWQFKVWKDFKNFEKEYTESSDGIVFLDAIRDTDIPTVLTLNRMRGLPDPDDSYLRWCYALYYRKDMKFPVIIPKEAKGMTNDTILSNGDIVLTKFPENVRLTKDEPQVTLTQINGMDYVIQPFDDMFHLSPRIIDPGDRDQ